MAAQFLAPGALVAGKLRVIRRLGSGGMGAVYEVEHAITKHRRALKVMLAGAHVSPSLVHRFLREASAAGHIGNPHIVETYDAGTLEHGEPYIVMELLEGEALSARIARGNLSLEQTFEIVMQAARGVQAAHDAGIVHRDIKPDNLFIVPGEPPFVKILDFGISKFDPQRTGEMGLTREGSIMGTPWYMAPEQVRGSNEIDGRADVYALGVVLYECITGKRPFEAQQVAELAVKIHEGNYPPPSTLCAVHADVDELIARAMAQKPEDRFQSPALLAAGIEELCQRQALALQATVYTEPPRRARAASAPPSRTLVMPEAPAATDGPVSHTRGPSAPPAKRPNATRLGGVAVLAGIVLVATFALTTRTCAFSTTGGPPGGAASSDPAIDAEPGEAVNLSSVSPVPSASPNGSASDAALDSETANAALDSATTDAATRPNVPRAGGRHAAPPVAPQPSASTRSQQQLPPNPF